MYRFYLLFFIGVISVRSQLLNSTSYIEDSLILPGLCDNDTDITDEIESNSSHQSSNESVPYDFHDSLIYPVISGKYLTKKNHTQRNRAYNIEDDIDSVGGSGSGDGSVISPNLHDDDEDGKAHNTTDNPSSDSEPSTEQPPETTFEPPDQTIRITTYGYGDTNNSEEDTVKNYNINTLIIAVGGVILIIIVIILLLLKFRVIKWGHRSIEPREPHQELELKVLGS